METTKPFKALRDEWLQVHHGDLSGRCGYGPEETFRCQLCLRLWCWCGGHDEMGTDEEPGCGDVLGRDHCDECCVAAEQHLEAEE